MKHILFILLLSSTIYAQNPTKFERVRITANVTSATAVKINVQETDGLINTIAKVDLIEYLEFASAINLPTTGVAGKLYLTKDNNTLYRWNGTMYVTVTVDVSGKENISNKQNSLVADGTGIKYPTVDAVRTHTTDLNNPHAVTKTQVGLSNVDNTSDINKPISTSTQTALNNKVNNSLLGVSNGVATLDGSGKVPLTQINDALIGSVNYKGTYDASTNTPTLPTVGSGNKGFYFIVSTAGTQVGLALKAGDWIISNGVSWDKVDNNNAVTSVNTLVGAVVLTTANISDSTNKRYQTDAQQLNNDADAPIQGQLNLKANIASPSFTDVPSAPTASPGTNTTQLATTAFVNSVAHWTKTVNDIKNNNTGEVFIKPNSKISILNSAGTEVSKIGIDGNFTSTTANSGFLTSDLTSGMYQLSGDKLVFRSAQSGFSFEPIFQSRLGTGTFSFISFRNGFNIAPTSGTVITNLMDFTGVINQTGGANGITRGLYINPILTSAFDFRAIEVTAGKVLIPNGTTGNEAVNFSQLSAKVSGTGTSGNIVKWTGTGTQGNGGILDNSTVNLLTLNSSNQVEIKGSSTLTNAAAIFTNTDTDFNINASSSSGVNKNITFFFNGGSGPALKINTSGGVMINTLSGAGIRVTTSDPTGNVSAVGLVPLRGYTVATLPAGQQQGMTAFVTDALAPSYMVGVVGGGTVVTAVFYNGTTWISH